MVSVAVCSLGIRTPFLVRSAGTQEGSSESGGRTAGTTRAEVRAGSRKSPESGTTALNKRMSETVCRRSATGKWVSSAQIRRKRKTSKCKRCRT